MKKIFIFVLTLLFVKVQVLNAQPSNDDLCNAILLNLDDDCSATLPYDNLGGSAQIGEPLPPCFTDGTIEASVWFYFAAPESGVVSITTDFYGSGMQDSQIALFESSTGDCSDLFTLNLIACNEDATPFAINTDYNAAIPPVSLTPGQFYFIQVDGYLDVDGSLSEGDFCIVVEEINPPLNDDCANAEVYGGFGPMCTKIFSGTTIGATASNAIDVFSCDGSEFNATVYYSFNSGVEEVEFNLLSGENINVSLFTNENPDFCDGSAVEVGTNCFNNIDASAMADPMDADLLFTNLNPQTSYLMAIWTNEGEATDFEFCLVRAPDYECGDGVCYSLIEDYASCPQECPCVSHIDFYSFTNGIDTNIPEAVCPEIIAGITDPDNPGLYIPFRIETNDGDLSGSLVNSTTGTLFTSSRPPMPLPNNEATNFFTYLFLTEAELAAGGDVSISFTSDEGACNASTTFAIEDINRPETSECGGCDLDVVVNYDNATCVGPL